MTSAQVAREVIAGCLPSCLVLVVLVVLAMVCMCRWYQR